MKRTARDWLIVMVLLLDELAVVVLVLLALWYFDVNMPASLAVVLALVLGGVVFLTHRVIIPSFHRKEVTGRSAMVGLEGSVIEPLRPDGMVRVTGECWKATAPDGYIPEGETIEVIGSAGLTLTVRRKGGP